MKSRGTRMSKYAWWRSAPALETECWTPFVLPFRNGRMLARMWQSFARASFAHSRTWKTYCMISFACIGTSKPIQIFTRWTLQYQLIIDLMSSFWRKGITSSKSMRRMQLSKRVFSLCTTHSSVLHLQCLAMISCRAVLVSCNPYSRRRGLNRDLN